MADDIIFGIGADNSELKKSTDEAKKLIDDWAKDIEARVNSIELKFDDSAFKSQLDKFDFSNPVEMDLSFDDGPLKDLMGKFDKADGKVGKIASKLTTWGLRIAKAAGLIGLVVTAATKVAKATESWTRSLSGYNQELARSRELMGKLAEQQDRIASKEVSAAKRDSGEDIDKEIEKLRKLEEIAREARDKAKKDRDAAADAQKALVADAGDNAQNDFSVSAFFNNRSGFVGQFFDGKWNSQLDDELADAETKFKKAEDIQKKFQAALESAGERKLDQKASDEKKATDEKKRQAEEQRKINEGIDREIALKKEAQLRVEGKDGEAEKMRLLRIEEDAKKRFAALGKEGAEDAAKRVVAAEKELFMAKQNAEFSREAAEEEKQKAEDRKRISDKIDQQKAKLADFEDRTSVRRKKLLERNARERKIENRAIGGIDSSFEAMVSRIQSAANTPNDRKEREIARLDEIAKLDREAATARKNQTDAIKKLAEKLPIKPQGLL